MSDPATHPEVGGNIFSAMPAAMPDEHLSVLLERPAARLERIVSRGHASPEGFWYDQPADEWVCLLSGRATLRFDDGRMLDLTPGDYLLIPAHCRHRVQATSPDEDSVWLALHVES